MFEVFLSLNEKNAKHKRPKHSDRIKNNKFLGYNDLWLSAMKVRFGLTDVGAVDRRRRLSPHPLNFVRWR